MEDHYIAGFVDGEAVFTLPSNEILMCESGGRLSLSST